MPFCESICGFCGFYRKPVAGFAADLDAVFDRFTGNLVREIRMWSECSLVRKMKVGAVYVGGGTPSTLPVANIDRILRAIRASLPVPRDVEFTFEGEVRSLNDRTKLALLREHGVSLQNLEADLQSAVDRLRCSHIDLYDTILYPNTEFFARRHYFAGLVPSDPERLEMVRFAAAYLRSRNYTQITSDDYVLPGAGYGMKFLNFGGPDGCSPVLAIGPSAIGFVNEASYRNRGLEANIGPPIEALPIGRVCPASVDELRRRAFVYAQGASPGRPGPPVRHR